MRVPGRTACSICAPIITWAWPTIRPSAQAAREALDHWGYGLACVRFICGTQQLHRQLETRLSEFLGTEDTILYCSCFDANGGLFETLLGGEDAIISDELNHASIIDGVRLCKAQRFRYKNNDMADLEARLREAQGARFRMIATDGVFSMDGYIANLPAICDLADQYGALVMVDDSHAVGFMGRRGRGTPEYHNVMGRVDILTGTFGKALGGASGGYTSGRAEIVEYFAAAVPAVSVFQLRRARRGGRLAQGAGTDFRLDGIAGPLGGEHEVFPGRMSQSGFHILPGEHPIVPIILGEAALATRMAEAMLAQGFTSLDFPFRWCRKARPGFAPRSPPCIPGRTWLLPSRHSRP